MRRAGEGGLQWGPRGWGGVTCWVPAATELTPPVSPVTGGRHHVSPEASLRDGWAPFLGPTSRSPPGRGSPGAAGARGLFLCSLDGGRAASNGQRPDSLGPSSGREEGLQPVALLPGAQLWLWVGVRGASFFGGGVVGNFSSSARPGRVGIRVEKFFFTVWRRWGEHR